MSCVMLLWLVSAASLLMMPRAQAHTQPLSTVDLRLGAAGIDATVEAPAIDFAHDLPDATPEILLSPAGSKKHARALTAILAGRLTIQSGGQTLRPALRAIEPVASNQTIRLGLRYDMAQMPDTLDIRCQLFPYDPRHKTFLNIYQNDSYGNDGLQRQLIFTGETAQQKYAPHHQQGTLAVMQQFVFEGVHHIFIGPDHILFIIGLLLLGGTLHQLLKIVTAFTIAHSVTLALATLNILNPSARLIEPLIALSIVFVGLHDMAELRKRKSAQPAIAHEAGAHEAGSRDSLPRDSLPRDSLPRDSLPRDSLPRDSLPRDLLPRDWRVLFAFGFGFIHGFGFANVLREMELPMRGLGWSLFGFNLGVEFGQAAIVLAVAPALALIYRHSHLWGRRVAACGALGVVVMGAFWFVQRVVF